MANPHEIRNHIAAVEQTRKITNAMEMVSSTRMRRVIGHIAQNNLYFSYVRRAMKEILISSGGISHPYLNPREGKKPAFVVISGDKGLCGPYNTNVLQLARSRIESAPAYSLITVGIMAEAYFKEAGITPVITGSGIAQDPSLHRIRGLVREILPIYDEGLADEIHVVYTSFLGATKNKPVEFQLLPIRLSDFDDVADARKLEDVRYHTSPQMVFDTLIPQYIIGIMFGVAVQAYASEHYSRMNAMRSATINADDMKKTLRIKYNLARQSAITNEIAEISSAAEIIRKEDELAYGQK